MAHIEIKFTETTEDINNMLVAVLAESDYEGFEEETGSLKAFIAKPLFDKERLDSLVRKFQVPYLISELPEMNWNTMWEANFEPVVVGNFCAIRADFHQPINGVLHEIIITPKMSFGTGHHSTTFMMIQHMEQITFDAKSVLDFGTGTGVLAILAARCGSAQITAVDNDDWSIANAEENIAKNGVSNIVLRKGDTAASDKQYDIILANITRNVILDNLRFFHAGLTTDGILLLSGLLKEDEKYMVDEVCHYGFKLLQTLNHHNWVSLRFTKKTP